MSTKPTQRDKVLAFLRDAGRRGVHTHELRAAFIGNPSQRIAELEAAGYEIEHKRERRNDSPGTRYILKSAGDGGGSLSTDGASQPSPSSADHDEPTALFGDEPDGRPSTPSAFDPFSEAA